MKIFKAKGTGITRIKDVMNYVRLTPPEFNIDGMFTVTLRRPFDFEKWVDKWVDKLTENRINILKNIHENSRISIRELSIVSGLILSAIDKNLLFLKELGLLERMNGAKGGNWIIHYKSPLVGR
jgi:ATP-dependent DNA helicase RecG